MSPHRRSGGETAPAYDVDVLRDVRIPVGENGITLSADLYRPVGTGPVPAVVTMLPYRKDALGGIGAAETLHHFAAHGYVSLLVDFRGTGSSDGPAHPPFDPQEAVDGVAVIEWTAAQEWCTGAVGMWGHSYGGAVTLRTAARRPPALRAIIPVMAFADPERDFVHPHGVHGFLGSIGVFGLGTLLDHMLPPLHAAHSPAEQKRWQQRLQETEPYLVDLCRHPPGHEVWRARAIDVSSIAVPALCVSGWRDLFCDGSLRAFESIQAPKKLLVGPWTHTVPHDSPFDPLDFHALALQWWDRWLADADNGVDREPPVTVHIQGDEPEWRQYESWPPADTAIALTTTPEHVLAPVGTPPAGLPGDVLGSASQDQTVGSSGGLWGIPTSGIGLPTDQHDDDLRGVCVDGPPLAEPLLLVGRPAVTVSFAPGSEPQRIVVKLTDVDPAGHSLLISGGMLNLAHHQPSADGGTGAEAVHEIVLEPTAYRVGIGHHLRVVIAAGSFPRLWPTGSESTTDAMMRVTGLRVTLPQVDAVAGRQATVPTEVASSNLLGLWEHHTPRWEISRDLVNQETTVTVGGSLAALTPQHEHRIETTTELRATVRQDTPDAARIQATASATVRMDSGETVLTRVECLFTQGAALAVGEVTVNGRTLVTRRWHAVAQTSGN